MRTRSIHLRIDCAAALGIDAWPLRAAGTRGFSRMHGPRDHGVPSAHLTYVRQHTCDARNSSFS